MKDLIDAMIYNSQLSKEAKLETLKEWKKDIQVSLKETMSQSFFESQIENYNYIIDKITELNK